MNDLIKQAREVLETEAQGILELLPKLDDRFVQAVEEVYACKGRVVVSGIGKSGIIGRKIMATLNSTGTPALFLHPVEAMHGDLGMVSSRDIALILSNSGETEELKAMITSLRNMGVRIIALVGNMDSTLACSSDICIDVGVAREACPLGLAPTTSTTAVLAMGDALSVALISKRKFSRTEFRKYHPGGALGRRLSIQVKEIMLSGDRMPAVLSGVSLMDAAKEIDRLNLGVVLVLDRQEDLQGIVTDGDLRRAVLRMENFQNVRVEDIMTPDPVYVHEDVQALEALDLMEQKGITCLVIRNTERRFKGMVHLHDLLGRGEFRFTHI